MSDYYIYLYCMPDGTPVYVGKGRGNRDFSHFKVASAINVGAFKGRRTRWHNFLAKRLREGVELTVEHLEEGLEEGLAMMLEIQYIMQFGRYRIEEGGTLRNTVSGANGFTSDDAKRLHADPMVHRKMLKARKLLSSNPTWRANVAKANRAKLNDPEWRERQLAGVRQATSTSDWREKNKRAAQRNALDPEWRKKQKEGVHRNAGDPIWLAVVRAAGQRLKTNTTWQVNHLEAMKKLHSDPNYRAKLVEGRRRPEVCTKQAASLKARVASDPKHRERLLAQLANALVIRRNMPGASKRRGDATAAMWARKRREKALMSIVLECQS